MSAEMDAALDERCPCGRGLEHVRIKSSGCTPAPGSNPPEAGDQS